MNTQINNLINEYNNLNTIFNCVEITDDELLKLNPEQDKHYCTIRAKYKGIPRDIRVVIGKDGERTIHIDRTYHFHELSERMNYITMLIGRMIIANMTTTQSPISNKDMQHG